MDDRLLTAEELSQCFPLERTTFWRMRKRGEFPEPIRIGRRIFWRLSAIDRWIDSRTVSSTREADELFKGGINDSTTSLVS